MLFFAFFFPGGRDVEFFPKKKQKKTHLFFFPLSLSLSNPFPALFTKLSQVPKAAYDVFGKAAARGKAAEAEWKATLASYVQKYPAEGAELQSLLSGKLPAGWEKALPSFTPEDKGLATRLHSQTMLNALAPALPGEFLFCCCWLVLSLLFVEPGGKTRKKI